MCDVSNERNPRIRSHNRTTGTEQETNYPDDYTVVRFSGPVLKRGPLIATRKEPTTEQILSPDIVMMISGGGHPPRLKT